MARLVHLVRRLLEPLAHVWHAQLEDMRHQVRQTVSHVQLAPSAPLAPTLVLPARLVLSRLRLVPDNARLAPWDLFSKARAVQSAFVVRRALAPGLALRFAPCVQLENTPTVVGVSVRAVLGGR